MEQRTHTPTSQGFRRRDRGTNPHETESHESNGFKNYKRSITVTIYKQHNATMGY